MYLQLDDIKAHLNIDLDFHGDDKIIMLYANTAENAIQRNLDTPLKNTLVNGQLPSVLQTACLLLIGNLYSKRESNNIGQNVVDNPTFGYLIDLYKDYFNHNEINEIN